MGLKIFKRHSFTLIELLIVLVILGIITTLAVPQYQKWVRRTHAAEAKRVLRALSDEVFRYYIEAARFPAMGIDEDSLNVKPPPSKYFDYLYHTIHMTFGWGTWTATVKGGFPSALVGENYEYGIGFDNTPETPYAKGQYMGKVPRSDLGIDELYRYYGRRKKLGAGSIEVFMDWNE